MQLFYEYMTVNSIENNYLACSKAFNSLIFIAVWLVVAISIIEGKKSVNFRKKFDKITVKFNVILYVLHLHV